MKKFFIFFVIFSLLETLAWAESDEALEKFKGMKGQIEIGGGSAHIPVMEAAAKRVMDYNPEIVIEVDAGGSGSGVRRLADGLIQIGNTGRALKPNEIQDLGLVSFPFAVDGIAVAVNPQNPVKELSTKQLKGIFSGDIKNWREVGGIDAPIIVYSRDRGSGVLATFEELAIGKGLRPKRPRIVTSNSDMNNAIAHDANAIGYLGIGYLSDDIKALTIDGMKPSQENAASGKYKITRLLYMNTKGQPDGLTKTFIDYIFSPAGAEIIREAGYLPLGRDGSE